MGRRRRHTRQWHRPPGARPAAAGLGLSLGVSEVESVLVLDSPQLVDWFSQTGPAVSTDVTVAEPLEQGTCMLAQAQPAHMRRLPGAELAVPASAREMPPPACRRSGQLSRRRCAALRAPVPLRLRGGQPEARRPPCPPPTRAGPVAAITLSIHPRSGRVPQPERPGGEQRRLPLLHRARRHRRLVHPGCAFPLSIHLSFFFSSRVRRSLAQCVALASVVRRCTGAA